MGVSTMGDLEADTPTRIRGSRVPIRTLADAEDFSFDQVANPDVVMWDLHESDELGEDRAAADTSASRSTC